MSVVPWRFAAARMLGPSYSLRCVVFHDVSSSESPFTMGMNVNTTPEELEHTLSFLSSHYTPVRLDDVLAESQGRPLPKRAVLVTFDDAYRTVVDVAAPLCRKFKIPAVFFVNAAFLDNHCLAPDNLVCYVANVVGIETVRAAARAVRPNGPSEIQSLSDVFSELLPLLTLAERGAFLQELRERAGIEEERLARESGIYLSSEQLRGFSEYDFEIGNHTFSHVYCRVLSDTELVREIDENKAELEARSGTTVRSFSQPYGSARDVTKAVTFHLKQTGHEAVFLSESVANSRGADSFHLNRVNSRAKGDDELFVELEVAPRLRAIRNRMFRSTHSDVPNL